MPTCKATVILGKTDICKDCMKADVCKQKANLDKDPIIEMSVEKCEYFKDKSKFIELPCKVGDTAYSIKHNKVDEYYVTSILIYTRTSVTFRLVNKYFTFFDVTRKDFGKTVFLTKGEAEKALEEHNNGK